MSIQFVSRLFIKLKIFFDFDTFLTEKIWYKIQQKNPITPQYIGS